MNAMFKTQNQEPDTTVLYCPKSGVRIAPADAALPPDSTPVAVAVFDDGTTVPIFSNSVLGRDPGPSSIANVDHYQRLRIADASRQISRTHLMFEVVGWKLAVIDLGSSNGTVVESADGSWDKLVPGLRHWVSNGQRIRLGSRELTLHRTTH